MKCVAAWNVETQPKGVEADSLLVRSTDPVDALAESDGEPRRRSLFTLRFAQPSQVRRPLRFQDI